VGFGRVVTDLATFGYLADVFVVESCRGQGLSKWMMECVMDHPSLQGFRRWLLGTRDAHGLYEKFGFSRVANPDRLMEIVRPEIYKTKTV
jgi:GNAT superfamily N-acetyltransferase